MQTRAFLFTILMLTSALSAVNAQSPSLNTLSGKLIDTRQHKPVDFANVSLLRAADSSFVKGTTSDANGKFTIDKISSGNYILRCFSYTYQVLFLPVSVQQNVYLDSVVMQSLSTDLKEVVVQGEKPMFAAEGEKNIYNVSEDPSIQTGNASDALQNAPGVEVDIEGNITLRGVSSVDIWINDKPSHLSAENLKTYIQQLPANSIERIEVITNPSARYGTSGDGGVINVVTKQKILKNQFVSFGVNASSTPSVTPWISYVWSNDKISINTYANFRWANSWSKSNNYYYSFDDQKDTLTYSKGNSYSFSRGLSSYLNFNLDYQIDTANTFSVWLGCYGSGERRSSFSKRYRLEYQLENENYDYTILSSDSSQSLWTSMGASFEHHFKKEGHTLQASLWGDFSNDPSMAAESRIFTSGSSLNKFIFSNKLYRDYSLSADLDYSLPYSDKGSVELGVAVEYEHTRDYNGRDTLCALDMAQALLRINDSLRSYDLHNGEWDMDMYATWQHKWGGFTLKAGVRGECTIESGRYKGMPQYDSTITFWKLLPSLHLSYSTKSLHNFSLSYVMRSKAPDFDDLTTYMAYDEESFSVGNPDLKPSYTHSFDGGWTKYFKKFGSVGVSGYFRLTTNQVSSVSDVAYNEVFGRVVNFSKPFNVSTMRRGGAEFRVVYRPKNFMNIRFYANLYDSYLKTHYENHNQDVTSQMFSYSFRLNFWAKLWKRLEIFASARYNSPTQSLYSERKANYNIDCGLRCDFFDRKLSVNLNVNDIFNWNKSENLTTNPYYLSYSYSKNSYFGRYISAGITVRFGKMELEKMSNSNAGQSVPAGSGGSESE